MNGPADPLRTAGPSRGIPAYCPHCQIAWESNAIGFGGSGSGGIVNIQVSGQVDCPLCHRMVELASGTYDFTGGQLHLREGPPLSYAVLTALGGVASAFKKYGDRESAQAARDMLQAVREGSLAVADAAALAERTGGFVAAIWKVLGDNSGQLSVLLTLIAVILQIYYGERDGANSSPTGAGTPVQATAPLDTSPPTDQHAPPPLDYEQVARLLRSVIEDRPVRGPKTGSKTTRRPAFQLQRQAAASPRNRQERRAAKARARHKKSS